MNQGRQRQILGYLREREDDMVNLLGSLVNIDSPSTDKECLDGICETLQNLWQDTGAQTEIIRQESYGNHLRAEWGQGPEQILVLCHMDTVWGKGEAARRPFRVEGGKAYGPGAYDMKAGIVEAIYAARCLNDLELSPPGRVVVLHNSDEEIGSPSSRGMIEEEAKKSKAVLVLEPSADAGAIKTWRKGVGMFQVKIAGRPAHAGSNYEMGASAIREAAHQVLYLHGLTDLDEGTTVNVGTIVGGSRSNVVAEETVLGVDLRVKTAEVANWVIPKIMGLRPKDPRVTVTVTGELNRPPMERNHQNMALFHLARSVGMEMGMQLTESGTGGGSDGNFTSALGIPTLDGLGPVGGGAHARDEYLLVSSLPDRASIVAGVLLSL